MDENSKFLAGLKVRREVLGAQYVDNAMAQADNFTQDLQQFVTEYAWGAVWTREGLDRAPGVFGDELLQIFGEFVNLRQRFVDVCGTQHLTANFQARQKVSIFVHYTQDSVFGELGVALFTRRRTDGLRLSQNLACAHKGARTVFAAHETRHGRAAKRRCGGKWGTRHFGFVTQTVWKDGGFCFSSRHWPGSRKVDLPAFYRGLHPPARWLDTANTIIRAF